MTLDLSDKAIKSWIDKLPPDVVEALTVPGEETSEGSGELINALNTASSSQILDLAKQYKNDTHAFGRVRRTRLIAWIANQTDCSTVIKRIEEEGKEGGEGEGGGSENVGVMFLEDIEAYFKVLAKRAAQQITSENNVESVLNAAAGLENTQAFSQKGVL